MARNSIFQTHAPADGDGPAHVPPSAPQAKTGTTRVVTALVGIPLVCLLVRTGGWAFWLVVAILALIGLNELERALERSERVAGARLVGLAAYPALAYWLVALGGKGVLLWPFDLVGLLLVLAVLVYGPGGKVSLLSLSLTLFATLYVGLFGFLWLLRALPGDGQALFWLTILSVWVSDTVAYFAGRAFGRNSLTPLSPGKTWEGSLGGFVAAVATAMLVAGVAHLSPLHGVVLGLLVAVAAPLGDLAESFWKRELGVKDLGTLLPGHGGVLDRCDSILFAAFTVYLYASRLM